MILRLKIGPYMAMVVVTLAITIYMVLGPTHSIKHWMQITNISWSFKLTILGMGCIYLLLAWIGENYLFQPLARWLGKAKLAITQLPKQKKEYKIIAERMQQ